MDPNIADRAYGVLTERHAERTAAEVAEGVGVNGQEALAVLRSLAEKGRAFPVSDDGFLSDVAWKRVRDTATRALTLYHKRNPYKRRAPDSELRPSLAKAAVVRDYLALKAALENAGVWVRESGGARLPDFVLELPPRWEAAASEMLPVFAAGGLKDPPWPGNFRANYPRDVPVDAVLEVLCEQGRLFRLDKDLYITSDTLEETKNIVRSLAGRGTPITISTVRDATGSSRRVVVPLLELLDRHGVTMRRDEERVLVSGE